MKHYTPRASFLAVALSALLLATGAFVLVCGPTPEEIAKATRTLLRESFWENATASDVRELLDMGADPNARAQHGRTPLFRAARSGHAEAVKMLIEAGADPNATTRKSGETPLTEAVYNDIWASSDNTEAIKALLEAGADPNVKTSNGGFTPLHTAARGGSEEAVRLLLEKGANPNARHGNGWTPLHLAASPLSLAEVRGNVEAVKLLIKAGADPKARDNDGQTPRHIARMAGSTEIAEILRRAGR